MHKEKSEINETHWLALFCSIYPTTHTSHASHPPVSSPLASFARLSRPTDDDGRRTRACEDTNETNVARVRSSSRWKKPKSETVSTKWFARNGLEILIITPGQRLLINTNFARFHNMYIPLKTLHYVRIFVWYVQLFRSVWSITHHTITIRGRIHPMTSW